MKTLETPRTIWNIAFNTFSNCTVSKWCSNTIQPDIRTFHEIANLLNIDVKDLLVSNITK